MIGSRAAGRVRRGVRSRAAEIMPRHRLARWLAMPAIVQSAGFGVFLTAAAIFFTRTVGLSTNKIGLGLTTANVFGADITAGSALILRRSGILLALCCPVVALTEHTATLIAVPLPMLASVVLLLGEISQAADAFRAVTAAAVGPILVTSLVVGLGRPEWAVMAVLFVLIEFVGAPLARSAENTILTRVQLPSPAS